MPLIIKVYLYILEDINMDKKVKNGDIEDRNIKDGDVESKDT